MNQSRIVFVVLILSLLGGPSTAVSKLSRDLSAKEISQLQKNIAKNAKNLRSRLFLAQHYFTKNQWKQVIATLSPVVERLPEDALFQLGKSYLKIGSLRESKAIANTLLSRSTVKTKHHLLAAQIYEGMIDESSHSEKATEWKTDLFETLKQAKVSNPTNREVYDYWLAALEKYIPPFAPEALRLMEDMKNNGVSLTASDYSRLCRYNHLASFSKATQVSCEQAIKKDPDNPSNYIYLGQTHIQNGDATKGKRMLASVGKKFSSSEEALWATASSHYDNKNIAAAYTYYLKAVKHKDVKPRDYLGLAKAAFDLKKYGVALSAFVKHCQSSQILDHEFRRASGLLKSQPEWQKKYRHKMVDCNSEELK